MKNFKFSKWNLGCERRNTLSIIWG